MSSTGKPGTAPCGHPGEHITTNYVQCKQGCDGAAIPEHIDPEHTEKTCQHAVTYWYGGYKWCQLCGRNVTEVVTLVGYIT